MLIAFIIGAYTLGYRSAEAPETLPPLPTATTSEVVHMIIAPGMGSVSTFNDIPYHANMSVADALSTLAEEKKIMLESKDYGGELGVFIESINGAGKGNSDAWWQFWVNGVYSKTGVSKTVLQPDGQIVFIFTGNQQ